MSSAGQRGINYTLFFFLRSSPFEQYEAEEKKVESGNQNAWSGSIFAHPFEAVSFFLAQITGFHWNLIESFLCKMLNRLLKRFNFQVCLRQ